MYRDDNTVSRPAGCDLRARRPVCSAGSDLRLYLLVFQRQQLYCCKNFTFRIRNLVSKVAHRPVVTAQGATRVSRQLNVK